MASYPASVRDVLAFHKPDRAAYDKLVALGTAPAVARNVVAFFMWLDHIGVDVLPHILRAGSHHLHVLRLVAEAESILDCLRCDAPPCTGADSALAIPLTASLVSEPIDLRFFHCNRDVAIRGIAQILDGVGAVIFDDQLHELLAYHEAAERCRRRDNKKLELPPELSRPYDLRAAQATPEDCRSMFITFSKGFPLRREDIAEYFTAKWGPCVERVMVEKTTAGAGAGAGVAATPVYGRIVFTSEAFIGLVLNGKQLVKFTIKGRQLWARKYEPRKNVVVAL